MRTFVDENKNKTIQLNSFNSDSDFPIWSRCSAIQHAHHTLTACVFTSSYTNFTVNQWLYIALVSENGKYLYLGGNFINMYFTHTFVFVLMHSVYRSSHEF